MHRAACSSPTGVFRNLQFSETLNRRVVAPTLRRAHAQRRSTGGPPRDWQNAARKGCRRPGGHDEKEQTLNQLLVEMDGFDARSGLVNPATP